MTNKRYKIIENKYGIDVRHSLDNRTNVHLVLDDTKDMHEIEIWEDRLDKLKIKYVLLEASTKGGKFRGYTLYSEYPLQSMGGI